jgi:glycosyltransferase involved in cell wall biosynthesis
MMNGSLRIIDPCAPRAYTTLDDMHCLGGTEATVLRIARSLAGTQDVTVEQAVRDAHDVADGLRFVPMDLMRTAGRTIIVINSWKVALICRRRNPDARICVWQHVVPGRHNRQMGADLADAGITIICVSHSLAATVRRLLPGGVEVTAIHNPVADDLLADATPRDPDLLLFASSPHKGMDQVARAFATLRRTLPGLRLELADPGYLAWNIGAFPEGVVALGTLTHAGVIAKMRQALCVFYPQTRFAETFGLVIAEANAVGCPALVHRGLGANDEVVSDASQCVDGADSAAIADRIIAWRKTPPTVTLRPQFRLGSVLADWRGFLAQSAACSTAHELVGAPLPGHRTPAGNRPKVAHNQPQVVP